MIDTTVLHYNLPSGNLTSLLKLAQSKVREFPYVKLVDFSSSKNVAVCQMIIID